MSLDKLANQLTKIPIYDIVIVTMGAIMINEFYVGLALHWFSADGFSAKIGSFIQYTNAPEWWKWLLAQAAEHAVVLAPLLAAFLLISGILMTLLIWRGVTAFIASLFFLVLWVSQWTYPPSWIFELLLPATIGFCAALGALQQRATTKSKCYNALGPAFFGQLKFIWKLLIVAVSTSWLWYAIILSENGFIHNSTIAWQTVLTFGVLLLLLAFLDNYRNRLYTTLSLTNKSITAHGFYTISWSDIIIIIIGSMLIIQVYADIAVGWFTAKGYAELTALYAGSTDAPNWFKSFLHWSSQHSQVLFHVQAVFEFSAALLLSMLVIRAPILLLTAGLLLLLMFSEFGVSARWPAHPYDPRTWTWELMFAAIVALFLGLQKLGDFIKAPTAKEAILGKSLFHPLHFVWRLLIILLAALALWGTGIATHIFGEKYQLIAWYAGITFFIVLFINVCLDYFRKHDHQKKTRYPE